MQALYIEPDSPLESGCMESVKDKLRDEPLHGKIFYAASEARALTKRRRENYNRVRLCRTLGYRPPTAEAITPVQPSA